MISLIVLPVMLAGIVLMLAGLRALVGVGVKAIENRRPKAIESEPGKELALPEPDAPVYELYDHPGPPIPLLAASLPTAPIGYGWEIVVVTNEAGNPALRCAMLNLRTNMVEDALEADLVIARRWKYANDETYASFYRRAQASVPKRRRQVSRGITMGYADYVYEAPTGEDINKMLGKVMMANLITPMVDWARLLVLRYIVEHPDETKCNYMLVESEEFVA
ncbi:hypothetical protein FHT44_005045 [Mycolicibacterium sp. BK634]|uniref:hypothetical protein n=1 Tax=Mycolicibacterium sp. BK634 TaxID=2587099 RepID=UPI001612CCDE|nr:hypothetical protein [Mycolicibacterium sp. BK634]MBB3752533.1 hypothetical protein [Mycolicibacterium sp. BK634]